MQISELVFRILIPSHKGDELMELLEFLNTRIYCRLDAELEPAVRRLEVLPPPRRGPEDGRMFIALWLVRFNLMRRKSDPGWGGDLKSWRKHTNTCSQ
jgi:hypothetical protein